MGMVTSYMRGHKIYWDDVFEEWCYADTKEIADDKRPCARCGRYPTPEGYDGCLGYIPDAWGACCGHGKERGYIFYKKYRRDTMNKPTQEKALKQLE